LIAKVHYAAVNLSTEIPAFGRTYTSLGIAGNTLIVVISWIATIIFDDLRWDSLKFVAISVTASFGGFLYVYSLANLYHILKEKYEQEEITLYPTSKQTLDEKDSMEKSPVIGNNVTESMSSTPRRASSKTSKYTEKSESHEPPSQNHFFFQNKALFAPGQSENTPTNPVASISSVPRNIKKVEMGEMEYSGRKTYEPSGSNLTMRLNEEVQRSKITRSRLEKSKLTRRERLGNVLSRIRSLMVVGAVMLMTVTGGGFYQAWNVFQMGISFSQGSTQESEEYNPAQDVGYWFAILVTLYFAHYASHAKSS